MKLIIILSFACLFSFCNSRHTTVVQVDNLPDTGRVIRQWQVLGPFKAKDKDCHLNEDNLKTFNLKESSLTFDDFKNIAPDTSLKDSSRISNRVIEFPNQLLLKFDHGKGNVYVGCIIRSDEDVKLRLNIATYLGMKVWLNQRLVPNQGQSKQQLPYWHYLPLNLNKGDNFLLIKVNNNADKGWELYASLEKESKAGMWRHAQAVITTHNHDFLESGLITDSVSNTLMVNNDFVRDNYQLKLSDGTKTLFHKAFNQPSKWKLDLSKLSDGLYWVQLKKGNINLNQHIFKGDIIEATANLIESIDRFNMSSEIRANVSALVTRYHIILKKPLIGATKSGTRGRQIRIIILYRQLLNVYDQLKANKSPYHHNPGTFIRTYTSEIDNSTQYYLLHVPRSYQKNKPLPIVFNMATTHSERNYLQSIRVTNSFVILNYGELANKYNSIVVELNSRTIDKHNYNTIEETDFFEVLNSVKKDYSIDSTRLYLTGFCMGSWGALKLAAKYPDKIAAISINAAASRHTDIDNKWLQGNEPLNYLRNLTNIPIHQVHSELDHHTKIGLGDMLNKEMKKNGLRKITYNRLPPSSKYFYTEGFEFYDQSFEYLCKQKLTVPAEVYFTTGQLKNNKAYWLRINAINYPKEASIYAKIKDNVLTVNSQNLNSYTIDLDKLPYKNDKNLRIIENGKEVFNAHATNASITLDNKSGTKANLSKTHEIEGPLAHVFTRKFIIVTGTLGNDFEDKKLNSMADSIDSLWSRRYLVTCIRKKDLEIKKEDIQNSNLVLLGNAASNSYVRSIITNIPLKVAPNYIKIGSKEMLGNSLGFYMLYPNPLNKQKYIAVIGYNNPEFVSLGLEQLNSKEFADISNYGWYDYKIWPLINSGENIEKGYFESNWK